MGAFTSAAIYEAKSSWAMGWVEGSKKAVERKRHHKPTAEGRSAPALRQPGGVAWCLTPAGRVFFSAHPLPY